MVLGPHVLALDIRTSSVRAMLFDELGRLTPNTRWQIAHRMRVPEAGACEYDADALVEMAATCIDRVVTMSPGRAASIVGVGTCTFWHSVVGVTAQGEACTPVYGWSDTRSRTQAQALALRLDSEAYHARVGCALHPAYLAARLLWVREHRPAEFARAAFWLSPGDYLHMKLLGAPQTSISMASATGLLDQHTLTWDAETLDAIGLDRSKLPCLTDIDAPLRGLTADYGRRWPALAGAAWVPAIGHGAAGTVGSGCTDSRRSALHLGASGAMRVLEQTDHVQIPPALSCYRLDRSRVVVGGTFSAGGAVHAWGKRVLNLDENAEDDLAARTPDSHGLTVLPSPVGDTGVTLHGLTLSTTALDILHAGMETVVLQFAQVHRSLEEAFPKVNEIVASGSALDQSMVWANMVADALGVPIILSDQTEVEARGAALVALTAAGVIENESRAPAPLGPLIRHDPGRHAVLSCALERRQGLCRALLSTGVPPP